MPNFAQVTLIGHLGKNPETKAVGTDSVTSFSIATTRKRKDQEFTTWWNCSMWGKRGAMIGQYLGKGDPILVTGEPFQRPYKTKDGREGVSMEVDVRDWSFVGSKGDQGGSRDAHSASHAAQAPSGGAGFDEDIPFQAYQAGWAV
jgi:single-strand DNA-binding protein